VAVFYNFGVSKPLSQFESGPEISDDCYRLMINFPEIDLNTPAVSMLCEHGFCTRIVDSFELEQNSSSGNRKLAPLNVAQI
jgi:hypothetical protein